MRTKPATLAQPVSAPPQRNAPDPLARVLAHIERDLFAPLSVATLAEVAALSPFHFSRLFTARHGLCPPPAHAARGGAARLQSRRR
jgi:AraC-like DNA-binding protein